MVKLAFANINSPRCICSQGPASDHAGVTYSSTHLLLQFPNQRHFKVLPVGVAQKARDVYTTPHIPQCCMIVSNSQLTVSMMLYKSKWTVTNAAKQEILNQFLITDPTSCQLGFDLNRSDWTILNRHRTGHGISAALSTNVHWRNSWWASGASHRKQRFNHMAPQVQHTLDEDCH